ncbi:MAG: MFS transporter [Pseudonocardiales bacterium]|nr:MAG: MFS transporter [Pseudonocardiales bacterium]
MRDWTLALLALAQLIISIDYNIVYVALPDIGAGLHFGAGSLQWVVSAYAVAFGGFLLFGGRACDRVGPRRVFLAGLLAYGVSSLVGGLAPTPEILIAARALQGIGGALLFPATLALISVTFAEGSARNRAFAVWGTAGGSGMILGSLLGGVLTDVFGWAAVFYVNVPLVLAAVLLARVLLAPDATDAAGSGRSFAVPAAVTATLGISLIVFSIVQGPQTGWTSPTVLAAIILGAAALAVYRRIDRRSADPLVPASLIRSAGPRSGAIITFLYMATFGTLLYFLTIYFQTVRGYSPLTTGLAFLVPMVAIAAGAQLAGRLGGRFDNEMLMLLSLVVGGLGIIVLVLTLGAESSYLALVPGLVVTGIGQGAGYTLMFGIAAQGVAPASQGIAAGLASTTQQIGGAAGLAVLVAVTRLDHLAGADPAGVTAQIRGALIATIVGIGLTVVVAAAAVRARRANPIAVPTEHRVTVPA